MRISEIQKSKGDLADEMSDMLYMLRKAQMKGDLDKVEQLKRNIVKIKNQLFEPIKERKLSKKEVKTRDKYADDLPDKEFKKRYGKDWESVKYATATKMAKKKNEDVNESLKPGTEVELYGQHRLVKPYGNNTSTTPDPLLRYEVVGSHGDNYIIQDEEGGQWEVADYSIQQTTGKYQPYSEKHYASQVAQGLVSPGEHYGDVGRHDPKVRAAIDQASSYDDSYDDQRYFKPGKAYNPWGVKGRPADGPDPDEYDAKRAETRKKIERHQREKAERERIKALKQKRRNEDIEKSLMDQWLTEKNGDKDVSYNKGSKIS